VPVTDLRHPFREQPQDCSDVAALVAFLAMVGIALARHPLGWLARAA